MLKAASFFKAVYRLHRSEAVALLVWREESRDLRPDHTPPDRGRGPLRLRIKRDAGGPPVGWAPSTATPGLKPFTPNGTTRTSAIEDGFHITIGNIDQDPTLACSVVVQGARAQIPPEAMIQPFPLPWDQPPQEGDWSDIINEKVTPLPRPIEFGT